MSFLKFLVFLVYFSTAVFGLRNSTLRGWNNTTTIGVVNKTCNVKIDESDVENVLQLIRKVTTHAVEISVTVASANKFRDSDPNVTRNFSNTTRVFPTMKWFWTNEIGRTIISLVDRAKAFIVFASPIYTGALEVGIKELNIEVKEEPVGCTDGSEQIFNQLLDELFSHVKDIDKDMYYKLCRSHDVDGPIQFNCCRIIVDNDEKFALCFDYSDSILIHYVLPVIVILLLFSFFTLLPFGLKKILYPTSDSKFYKTSDSSMSLITVIFSILFEENGESESFFRRGSFIGLSVLVFIPNFFGHLWVLILFVIWAFVLVVWFDIDNEASANEMAWDENLILCFKLPLSFIFNYDCCKKCCKEEDRRCCKNCCRDSCCILICKKPKCCENCCEKCCENCCENCCKTCDKICCENCRQTCCKNCCRKFCCKNCCKNCFKNLICMYLLKFLERFGCFLLLVIKLCCMVFLIAVCLVKFTFVDFIFPFGFPRTGCKWRGITYFILGIIRLISFFHVALLTGMILIAILAVVIGFTLNAGTFNPYVAPVITVLAFFWKHWKFDVEAKYLQLKTSIIEVCLDQASTLEPPRQPEQIIPAESIERNKNQDQCKTLCGFLCSCAASCSKCCKGQPNENSPEKEKDNNANGNGQPNNNSPEQDVAHPQDNNANGNDQKQAKYVIKFEQGEPLISKEFFNEVREIIFPLSHVLFNFFRTVIFVGIYAPFMFTILVVGQASDVTGSVQAISAVVTFLLPFVIDDLFCDLHITQRNSKNIAIKKRLEHLLRVKKITSERIFVEVGDAGWVSPLRRSATMPILRDGRPVRQIFELRGQGSDLTWIESGVFL